MNLLQHGAEGGFDFCLTAILRKNHSSFAVWMPGDKFSDSIVFCIIVFLSPVDLLKASFHPMKCFDAGIAPL
jgi:hypothetical protein